VKRLCRHWWWLVLLVPMVAGLWRLQLDVEVLNLLPDSLPVVHGIKLYQKHFTSVRELVVTVRAPDAEVAESATRRLAEALRQQTNLVAKVVWQPAWLEHPEQVAELLAYLWLNQAPESFAQLTNRLARDQVGKTLREAREDLATSLSPMELGRLSYDPLGFTRLPESSGGLGSGFGGGQELFASADGLFRILFLSLRGDVSGYRACQQSLTAVQKVMDAAVPPAERATGGVAMGCTGRPAFVAEISGSMQREMVLSIGGTALIIALLFWLAHRRWKPMLWLLTLLALVLAGTLALGGLILGVIHVISMGFAAVLLGLAVDYAVVHYQEALAHPKLSVPEIRRAIAPSIFWAATTTIAAFLVLNFGGLPGLAQLGSLVGVGVALAAGVMIFAFLPPLFPDRRQPKKTGAVLGVLASAGRAEKLPCGASDSSTRGDSAPDRLKPGLQTAPTFVATAVLILFCVGTLFSGLPGLDPTAKALQPRHSLAYATLEAVQRHLAQERDPLCLVVEGHDETEVADRLAAVEPVLRQAVSNGVLTGFTLPAALWPHPKHQAANLPAARRLAAEGEALRAAALANGFTPDALGLADNILGAWQRAPVSTRVLWPTNELCDWLFQRFAARAPEGCYAAGALYASTNRADLASLTRLQERLPQAGVWISGWELLGGTVLATVQKNLWKLLAPMIGLVLLSLWLAFRRSTEILLSLSVLAASGLLLLSIMKLAGWSWNVLNLMALPLILGTGVDYSIFMQLALRRHHGDRRVAHRSVGRALLLCGGTAIAGFGSLAWSSNAGMASLGQVCAAGIAGNMLFSVFLLPVWWSWLTPRPAAPLPASSGPRAATSGTGSPAVFGPSAFYRARLWRLGLALVRVLPGRMLHWFCLAVAEEYYWLCPQRRKVVVRNLLPVVGGDRAAAELAAHRLFRQFARKLADLWRYESGCEVDSWFNHPDEWHLFETLQARRQGVLIVTPHLGNWEIGGPLLARRGVKLLVLTLAEPGRGLTELRLASRARWGIETLVIGGDGFAFVEIIKRLQDGATVALLMDRPPAPSAVTIELFGRPFRASMAAAELARASGCALLGVSVVHTPNGYAAHILPEFSYDRRALGTRETRRALTQQIMRAFEPEIRQHPDQWYHFVPIWPEDDKP
jgi:uncharacterized protein